MDKRLIDAFDQCLLALTEGASLEECLQRYPDLAEELAPRLQMALRTQTILQEIQPSPDSQAASRAKFLLKAGQARDNHAWLPGQNGRGPATGDKKDRPAPWTDFLAWLLHPRINKALGVFAILIVFILAGTGVLQVSAQSLPGTPFYGLKRAIETTRLALSLNPESRARLEDRFIDQHIEEVRQVTERGWKASLEFGGILETMEGEHWTVGGIKLFVPASAGVKGTPEPGLYVKVRGSAEADGTVLVSQVDVDGVLFQGRVEQIQAGTWQIDGRQVYTGNDSRIDEHLVVGDLVEVNAMLLSDGNMLAERIKLVAHEAEEPAPGQKNENLDDHSGSPERTLQPGSEDHAGDTPGPTRSSGSDDHGGKPAEPTHTPSAQDGGLSPTGTPHGSNGGDSTGAPTDTPQPTHAPDSGGSKASPTNPPVQEIKFQGVLQSIAGNTWTVDGQVVLVDANTRIENDPKVGDTVEVEANAQPDGSLSATRIRNKN